MLCSFCVVLCYAVVSCPAIVAAAFQSQIRMLHAGYGVAMLLPAIGMIKGMNKCAATHFALIFSVKYLFLPFILLI